MAASTPATAPFRPLSEFGSSPVQVAVVVDKMPRNNLHAGIVHKKPNAPAQFLHLEQEDRLSRDWQWAGHWGSPDVEPERLKSIATLARLIWNNYGNGKHIPFALGYFGARFNPSGVLILGPGGKGLTCASFVLAVFKAMGIELVDEATWPKRVEEDVAFADFLAQGYPSEQHHRHLQEARQGVRRVRPSEVLASCRNSPPPPADFALCSGQEQEIQGLFT